MPVQEATWCSDFGGVFAVEVPVIDIWRIIASFDPLYSNYTNSPDPDTEIHVHDIWISVPSSLHRKALVYMDFRPEPHFTPYDRASVSTELFAIAMCGGTGLPADRLCDEVLYSSANAGWETIKVPIAFAFTLIPVPEPLLLRRAVGLDNGARCLYAGHLLLPMGLC